MRRSILVSIVLFFVITATVAEGWKPTGGPHAATFRAFASHGDCMLAASSGDGVYVSRDSGKTWDAGHWQLEELHFTALYLDDSIAIAGPYISRDRGENWELMHEDSISMDVSLLMGASLFIVDNGDVYRSRDKGDTWEKISELDSRLKALVIKGDTVFAGQDDMFEPLLYSVDSCLTWQKVVGHPSLGGLKTMILHKDQLVIATESGIWISPPEADAIWGNISIGGQVTTALASRGEELYAGTERGGLYKSENMGFKWDAISQHLPYKRVYAVHATDSELMLAADWGAYRSTNSGDSWDTVLAGASNFMTQAFTGTGRMLFAAHRSFWRSRDLGETWENTSNSFTANVSTLCMVDSLLFAGTNGKGVYCSLDSGVTWESRGTGLASPYVEDMTQLGDRLFVTTWEGIYYSDDLGQTWTLSKSGTAYDIRIGHGRVLVEVDNKVYVSVDSGKSWDYAYLSGQIYGITSIDSVLFVSEHWKGVHRSYDGGETWELTNHGLTNRDIFEIYSYNGVLYVGTNEGVFVSKDQGDNWMPYNAGLAFSRVTHFYGFGDTLLVGTSSRGVWQRETFSKDSLIHMITVDSSKNGTLFPVGTLQIPNGEKLKVQVTPKEHYKISNLIVDSASLGVDSSYTFTSVTADHHVRAEFEHIICTVTVNEAAHGTLDPVGKVPIKSGTSLWVAVTPDDHYKTTSIKVDKDSIFVEDTILVYDVRKNLEVDVIFSPLDSFTITTHVTGSGTVSPSKITRVEERSTATLLFTPNPENELTSLIVNNEDLPLSDSLTFQNVRRDYEVYVIFELMTPIVKEKLLKAQSLQLTRNPLPASDDITMILPVENAKSVTATLFDPLGNELLSREFSESGDVYILQTGGKLQKGSYLLFVEVETFDKRTLFYKQVVGICE